MEEVITMHHHPHQGSPSVQRLAFAFVLNFVFTIAEIIGGLWTNSIALLTDSIHDLGDSLSLGLAWMFEKKSQKKPDLKFTYGYKRYSLLGGLFAGMMLIAGSAVMIVESVKRIIAPQPVETELLIYFAIFGVIINLVAAIRTRRGASANERIVTLHLLEDVIGWALLLIAAIVMHFTGFAILDALLSVGFTIWIVLHAITHLRRIIDVMMEASPKEPAIHTILETMYLHPEVANVHHLHHWTIEGETSLLTAHIVLQTPHDFSHVSEIQERLHRSLSSLGFAHATLEFELADHCVSQRDEESDCP